MPRIIPEPRYFSMPSMDVGAEARMKRDLNCWPWVRSLTHSPDAVTHSPAAITAAWPITVINSRWPRALIRSTQKPFSALWKVTRSTSPARISLVAGSSGAGLFTRCRAPLAPHAAQPRPDINTDHRLRHRRVGSSFGSCCCASREQREDVVGQEPRAWGDRVAAAEAMLVGAKEPQRLNQMKMLLGAGHGDIEQAALFVDLRRIAGGHVGGDAAIDEVQHVDRIPFLPFGRMDRRQDQIILVEPGPAGFGARRIGRVERHFGEEAFAVWVTHGDLLELVEIPRP